MDMNKNLFQLSAHRKRKMNIFVGRKRYGYTDNIQKDKQAFDAHCEEWGCACIGTYWDIERGGNDFHRGA
jgi:hypothetical protein